MPTPMTAQTPSELGLKRCKCPLGPMMCVWTACELQNSLLGPKAEDVLVEAFHVTISDRCRHIPYDLHDGGHAARAADNTIMYHYGAVRHPGVDLSSADWGTPLRLADQLLKAGLAGYCSFPATAARTCSPTSRIKTVSPKPFDNPKP